VDFSGVPSSAAGIEATSATGVKIYGNDSKGTADGYIITAVDTQVNIEDLGTPEGVVSAAIGSIYRRLDGGAATSFYVKESGTGNTGWVAK
jgi:hypothetical protein